MGTMKRGHYCLLSALSWPGFYFPKVPVPESSRARRVGIASLTLFPKAQTIRKANSDKAEEDSAALLEYFPWQHEAAVLGVNQTRKPLEICLSLF